MSDNVVPFPQNPTDQPSRHASMAAFLRSLANDLDSADDGEPTRVALAFFITDGNNTDVQCGGFRDDQAAIKYLSAFIRNQGFA